ncbi:hypothetical protein ALP64_200196 [Pseudomonas syringae pv. actinidiae]|nr:hypothetical protein ALP64_200196 [Pseudomonas syringae pv. actinidiae]
MQKLAFGGLPCLLLRPYLFGLAQHCATLLRECRRGPHDADVSIDQMGVVFVVNAAGVGQDLCLYPPPYAFGWHQAHEHVGLIR